MPPVLAYIGPGAGIAFAGSFLSLIIGFFLTIGALAAWPFRAAWAILRGKRGYRNAKIQRLIFLGLDGLDPRLTERFMAEGKLPNLSRLKQQGLEGTYGTFTYYTDDPLTPQGPVSGGRIVTVEPRGNRVILPIEGPANTLRRDRRPAQLDLITDIDPDARAMRGRIGDQQFILRQGEWSPWIHVRFSLIPGLSSMAGMFHLYARELSPSIRIYRSPLNIDPAQPALPISYPSTFSRELSRRVGPYYTQGIPEDTSALRQGALTLDEYLAQSRLTAADDNALLDESLSHFQDGLLFFYFSEIDQDSHMLWSKHEPKLLETYQYIDRAIGRVLAHAAGARIIVMSDHGFAAFDRSVNLNTWLAQEGLRTKAYALGVNALYINLTSREKPERDALLQELIRRLRELRDPATGQLMIESVSVVGPSSSKFAPDLIVGYAPRYRASWETALGEAPPGIVHQNTDAWIGDHCIAAEAVPGVLLGNRPPRSNTPRLKDITVTILKEFDVPPGPAMSGTAVYSVAHALLRAASPLLATPGSSKDH